MIKPLAAGLTDLNAQTADDLAQTIQGSGVVVNSVTYTGDPVAAGSFEFTGEDDVLGFGSGIVLSSGSISNAQGPNDFDDLGADNSGGTDDDLAAIVAPRPTFDAAALELEFTPAGNQVFFEYVFASEEYNEYANSSFNDAFALFLNGENYALVNGQAVEINSVNGGNPFGTDAQNPEFFRNNDPNDPGPPTIYTEYDGLTTTLVFAAPVNPNVINTLKIAITDVGDPALDSAVFVKAGSLSTEEPGQLELTPPTAIKELGETHTVVGTAKTTNGAPVVGTPMTFTVISGPNAGETGVINTDDLGQASFSYVGDGGVGTDTIEVSFVDGLGTTQTQQATVTWGVTPANITLLPATSTADVGTESSVTATVTSANGTPVAGAQVLFEVPSGPQQGTSVTIATDENGQAVFSYTGAAAGTDQITATVLTGEGGEPTSVTTSAQITWEATAPVAADLTLNQTTFNGQVGDPQQVVATVTDEDGNPIEGAEVVFEITEGPNAGTSETVLTGANGTATFNTTSQSAGTDTLVVSVSGTSLSQTATLSYAPSTAPTAVSLDPDTATLTVDETQILTATVTDAQGNPVEGAIVSFSVAFGSGAPTVFTVPTDENGQAVYELVGRDEGVYTVTASVEGVDGSDTSTITFEAADSGTADVILDPDEATLEVGQTQILTATITDAQGNPVEGVLVNFSVSFSGNTQTFTVPTNANGQAVYELVGENAGQYLVTASVEGVEGTDTSVITFVPPSTADVTTPACALASISSGPPVTLNIEVQDQESGVASIEVLIDENAAVVVPEFDAGTTEQLTVTAAKVDSSRAAQVELRVTDVAGNITVCDPVLVTLSVPAGASEGHARVSVPQVEDQLTFRNGAPGVSELRLSVNGSDPLAFSPNDGDVYNGGLPGLMTETSNMVDLSVSGAPGSSILVMFHDGSATLPAAELGALSAFGASSVNLDWGNF